MSVNKFQLRGTGLKWILIVLMCQLVSVSSETDFGNHTGDSCPVTITDKSGTINSTSWTIPEGWNCTWYFNVSEVFVQVFKYDTLPDDVMTFLTPNGELITTLKGTADDTFIVYMGGKINSSIHFQASGKKTKTSNRRFDLKYYKGCEQSFTSETGYFRSPRYPVNETVQCNYTFTMDPKHYDRVPALTFTDIKLSNDTVTGLSNGKVVGKCNEFSKRCQDMLGQNKKLVLTTKLTGNNSRFEGIYIRNGLGCTGSQTIKKVGDKVTVSLDSSFKTTNVLCRNLVQGPAGHALQINVTDIKITSKYDVLEIHDGNSRQDPLLWRYQNGMPTDGSLVLTSGPAAWIQFSKDETQSHPLFTMTLQSLDYGGSKKDKGSITFPQKKQSSESNKQDEAHYQLSVIPGKQVVLTVSQFDLQKTSGYFEYYEGFEKKPEQLIKRYSGNMKGKVFTNSNRMLLIIHGDLTKLVFKASFEKTPDSSRMLYSRGSSGGFSARTDDSTWMVLKPDKGVIAMTLNLYLPKSAYVIVTDGDTSITMNSTGRQALPVTYFYHDVTLLYSPDNNGNSTISCHYDVIKAVNAKVKNSNGHISSPYYPNQYPYNAKSAWTFIVPSKQALHIAFKNFHLATNHTLTIRDLAKNTTRPYFGDVLPDDVIVPNNVKVEFFSKSNLPVSAQGFEAGYQVSPCNQMLNGPNNVMRTPGFPNTVNQSTYCVWIIQLPPHPPKQPDSVNIVSFTYQIKGLTNASSTVQFHDGPSMSSSDFPVNLTEGSSAIILSRSNQLWINYKFDTSNKNDHGFAFLMNYTTHTCSKDELCDNGICMHKDWICNGHDNCGDGSDEKNCTEPVKNTGVSMTTLALAIVFTFIGTVILTVFCPLIYKRLRRRNPPYDSLQEVMAPADN